MGEDDGNEQHQRTEDGVGQDDAAAALRVEEELSDGEGGEKRAQSVERLREVQSAGGCLWCSKLRNVWIGRRFEERQSASDDEEADEEGIERADVRARYEEERTGSEEAETEDDAAAIAPAVDEQSGRYGHEEVAQIGCHLDERRLRDGDVQLVLEVLVENVEDGSCESPEEEECGNKHKRHHVADAVSAKETVLLCFHSLEC